MSNQPDVLELTRKLGREPNLKAALLITQWELGDLAKSTVYADWHPTDAHLYKLEAKHALGSLLFQAEVIAQLLDTTSAEAFAFGVETIKDRIIDKERKLGRFINYEGDQRDE